MKILTILKKKIYQSWGFLTTLSLIFFYYFENFWKFLHFWPFYNFDFLENFWPSEIRDKKTLTAIKTITGGILNSCDVSYADHLRLEHIDTHNPMFEHIARATNWLCKWEKSRKATDVKSALPVQRFNIWPTFIGHLEREEMNWTGNKVIKTNCFFLFSS